MKIALIAWAAFVVGFATGAGWAAAQLTSEQGAVEHHDRGEPT